MKKKISHKKTQEEILTGVITVTGRGDGIVRERGGKREIEIEHAFLNRALHGDIVSVRLDAKKNKGKLFGEVTDILVRAKQGFAGTLKEEKGVWIFSPTDQKMYTDIIIPKNELGKAGASDQVFVIITDWKNERKPPFGKVLKILGKPGSHEAEIAGIALERGFDATFPNDVLAEAEKLHKKGIKEDIAGRRDMRGIETFTIDPADAKDFDDALSYQKLSNNKHEVGIHIADVSHYVRSQTLLDDEAYRRGTSVYLVDRTIPMLPEVLSNDLCSLKPNVDRLTMSAIFTLNDSGTVLNEWFGRTVIHSTKRLTYDEAQELLDKPKTTHNATLQALAEIAKHLEKKRKNDGSLNLNQTEVKFKLDAAGRPIGIYQVVHSESHRLIETYMLLANHRVAKFIGKHAAHGKKPFLYRIHDMPAPEKSMDLAYFLKKLGYHLPITRGSLRGDDLNKLLAQLEGKPEYAMVQMAIVRSMAKAIYSTKNIGHFGLAIDEYTHFTSPIRRYPDIMVHRLLEAYQNNTRLPVRDLSELERIAEYTSIREKSAADAERASIKYTQVKYMAERIGKDFDGVISGVTEWGLYVEEKESRAEGMIRIRDLGSEFFTFKEKEMTLIGEKTKKRYRIGDTIKITVKSADLERKTIDYRLNEKA